MVKILKKIKDHPLKYNVISTAIITLVLTLINNSGTADFVCNWLKSWCIASTISILLSVTILKIKK
ncbi:DUF2798 domain-containing protein [Flavobacterium branchiophilum]|uniref:Uncharacterized protein n=2 Tax=Flavobacterium branchiophilum TaxID=55197 RepID=G2Z489_FLABF|nr:DUF2798 domain-containing protein [Flavobacterium branchiophilum]PDS22070.1 DUF2798 domain-containing protein [Flavobacterium branchiophilum]CCB70578.1 Hypothetical protein FBFL15_2581 [Flavobacterium branchiophilum FL-15]